MNDKLRPAAAEFIGTFIYVFIGAGSLVTDSYTRGGVGLLGVALAQGLALAVMVSSFGAISGGHFNPAVTLGLWVARKINTEKAAFYIGAQLVGAVLAALLLRAIFNPAVWASVNLGTPSLAFGMTPLAAIVLEALLTLVLLLAYLGTTVDSVAPKMGGIGVGLAVAMAILLGGPLTGAAMNPARVFGPGLVAGFWEYHWVYWIGPIGGAALASWLYTRFLSKTI